MSDKTYPEIGTRLVTRYIEYRGRKGHEKVIETVGEDVLTWEGHAETYRYAVHWIPDYEGYSVERYQAFSACPALDNRKKITVPQELLEELEEQAIAHLLKRVDFGALLASTGFRRKSKEVVEIYFKNPSFPYELAFTRFPDGSIARTSTLSKKLARGNLAKGGNTGIPKTICKVAFNKAVECFEGIKRDDGSPQTSLFALEEHETQADD